MPVLLLLIALTAAPPAPAALPDLQPPLGRIKDVVDVLQPGGLPGDETVLTWQPPGCEAALSIRVTRFSTGMASAARQVQDWLNLTKGLEARVLGKRRVGALLEPVAALVGAQLASTEQCAPKAPLLEDYRLALDKAPKALCPAPAQRVLGEYWFLGKNGKPVAVVQVSPGDGAAKEKCTVRLSGVLFDKTGAARFALHAPWGGAASATLLGNPSIDFTFDAQAQVFKATERFPTGRPVR